MKSSGQLRHLFEHRFGAGGVIFRGGARDGTWFAGELLDPAGRRLDFHGEELWPEEKIRPNEEQWVPQSWDHEWACATGRYRYRLDLCRAALALGEPIVELAAGPGGGQLAPFLRLYPRAPVVANDIDWRILRGWRRFLAKQLPDHGAEFAAFDIRRMPFGDRTAACFSSCGGITNVPGSGQVLAECVRCLIPGGLLLAQETGLTADSRECLPEGLRRQVDYHSPYISRGWRALLEEASFRVEQFSLAGEREMDPEQDGLAHDAARFGVRLRMEFMYFVARRQG